MKSRTNSSCAACRLAKVKCTRPDESSHSSHTPCTSSCSRCTRLGLQCVSEKRRSKWDGARALPKDSPPLALAEQPAYGQLLINLNKLRPIIKTGLKPCCYAGQVVPIISRLIELALEKDDAAALAFAVSHIEQFRLNPSLFRCVLAGGSAGPYVTTENPLADEMDSPRTLSPSNSIQWAQLGDAPTAMDLPPHMAAHFNSDIQCLSWISINGVKHYLVNDAFCLDLDKIKAAVGPIEIARALGVPENDALRLFEMYAATVTNLMEKCNAHPNNVGYGSELPPVLQRVPWRGHGPNDAAAEVKPTLHVLRSCVHVGVDGETVYTLFRWVPLAQNKRRKVSSTPLQERVKVPPIAMLGAESETNVDNTVLQRSSEVDFLGAYDLKELLEDVGGEEGLWRELVAATSAC